MFLFILKQQTEQQLHRFIGQVSRVAQDTRRPECNGCVTQ